MTLATDTQLSRDSTITEPIAIAIAEQIVKQKTAAGLIGPDTVNLAAMITGVGEAFTMQGAPQLQINLEDEDFVLLDSGFWGADPTHGKLHSIQLNYPVGSKYWWRLRQVSPKADFSCETYWIPRVVRELMDIEGPFKASRGSRTRAQFLKMCCDKVPDIKFHCKQLDVKEPIASVKIPKSTAADSGAKSVGLTAAATESLTVRGVKMTAEQRDVAGTLIQAADKATAGAVATEALIYAGIWESNLSPKANNGRYWGVLSGSVTEWQQTDTVGMAGAFLHGGKGFVGQGAIGLVAFPYQVSNPVEIAVKVEAPSIWPDNAYAKESGYPGDEAALAEVKAIIEAGGGATGTGGVESGTETVQQYNFEIGTTEEPYENFWAGMNRLAQEVNWELVVDGPDVYYDSDITLVRAELKDVIERTDDNVADWEYDWDDNGIATNLVIVLVCEEFSYVPADAIKLKGFGPASEGSTMGLPGRWLLGEIQRNPGDIVASLTFVQPTQPLKEPAPTVSSSSTSGQGGSSIVGDFSNESVLAAVQASQQLGSSKIPYLWGGGHSSGSEVTGSPPPAGLDCSGSVSWVLEHAGFPPPAGGNWNGGAADSTQFEQWGEAGPGKEMTVWCNADHVFIEFNVPNVGHFQLNTSVPGHNGPAWAPWGPNGETDAKSGAFQARHFKGT